MEKPKNAVDLVFKMAVKLQSKELIWIRNLLNKQINYEKYQVLIKLCEITDKVAVHAKLMTEHQRKKHKSYHYNLNGKTYYVLDRTTAWTVGVVTDPDVYIYEV